MIFFAPRKPRGGVLAFSVVVDFSVELEEDGRKQLVGFFLSLKGLETFAKRKPYK